MLCKKAVHHKVNMQINNTPAQSPCRKQLETTAALLESCICFTGTIKVKVLPKVSTEGLTTEDVGMLTEKVQRQMVEVFEDDEKPAPRNDTIQTKKTK